MSDPVRIVRRDDGIEIAADLDRRQAEAFAVELRALVKRYGLRVERTLVRPAAPASDPAEPGDRSG